MSAASSVVISDQPYGRNLGTYRPRERRIIVWYSGQSLTQPDALTGSQHSVFAATVLHEIGESAWHDVLTEQQRRRYRDLRQTGEGAAQELFADDLAVAALRPDLLPSHVSRFFQEIGFTEIGLIPHTSIRPRR